MFSYPVLSKAPLGYLTKLIPHHVTNWYFNSYRELHYLLKLQKLKKKEKEKWTKQNFFPKLDIHLSAKLLCVWVRLWPLLRITYTTPHNNKIPSQKQRQENKSQTNKNFFQTKRQKFLSTLQYASLKIRYNLIFCALHI